MIANSNLRFLFCLCLVVALHVAIISILTSKNGLLTRTSPTAPSYLQYISIVQPTRLSAPPTLDKVRKADLPASSASAISVSSMIEHTTRSSNTPTDDAPKLDLTTLRANAVQHALRRERSPIELQNERNRRDQRLEARLEKSAKEAAHTDCRIAYSSNGLFAPLFITADLLSDKGCKF